MKKKKIIYYTYTPWEFHAGANDEPLMNYFINVYGLPILTWVMDNWKWVKDNWKLLQNLGWILLFLIISLFVGCCGKRTEKQKSS